MDGEQNLNDYEVYPEESINQDGDGEAIDEWWQPENTCQMSIDGTCPLNGSEYCDFECPYKDLDPGEMMELIDLEAQLCDFGVEITEKPG